ncbi:hypothetical protein T01_3685 [Trichinella spiralis]|uniref:Uncharacterized protein n=1 Tax=Trichinella spiralis TaxID=6334 RepID=A0A0V1AUV0_TRISP|nr:hypothetical protein T01_3685 [Trichinella spiralis]
MVWTPNLNIHSRSLRNSHGPEAITISLQTHVVQVGVFECSFYNLIFFKFIYDLKVAVKMNADDSNYTVGDVNVMKAKFL